MDKEVSRKDVVDYIRNQQKAEEIRAKLSGINIWVLWGALAIVLWHLLEGSLPVTWRDALQFFLHLTIASQIAVLLIQPAFNKPSGNELRYQSPDLFSNSEAPILLTLQMLWTLVPSGAYWVFFGFSIGSAFLGGLLVLVLAAETINEVRGRYGRFPAPTFERSPNERRRIYWVIIAVMLAVLTFEAQEIVRLGSMLELPLARSLLAALSAYWLLWLLLAQQQKHFRDAWTYRLERDLLLNLISVEDALRSIEHRTLGARVSDVMADYWHDLEQRQESLKERIAALQAAMAEIQAIPKEYKKEIKARIHAVVGPADNEMSSLVGAHEEFVKYAHKLKNSLRTNLNQKIVAAVKSLLEQHERSFSVSKSLGKKLEEARRNLQRG